MLNKEKRKLLPFKEYGHSIQFVVFFIENFCFFYIILLVAVCLAFLLLVIWRALFVLFSKEKLCQDLASGTDLIVELIEASLMSGSHVQFHEVLSDRCVFSTWIPWLQLQILIQTSSLTNYVFAKLFATLNSHLQYAFTNTFLGVNKTPRALNVIV